MSLGLVIVLSGASILTQSPRFVMLKPSIAHFAVAAVMLRRGWMTRYLPDIARQNLPESVPVMAGYAWAALLVGIGLANIAIALYADFATWAWFVSVGAVSAKIAAFLLQYAVFRILVRRNLISTPAAAEASRPLGVSRLGLNYRRLDQSGSNCLRPNSEKPKKHAAAETRWGRAPLHSRGAPACSRAFNRRQAAPPLFEPGRPQIPRRRNFEPRIGNAQAEDKERRWRFGRTATGRSSAVGQQKRHRLISKSKPGKRLPGHDDARGDAKLVLTYIPYLQG